MFEDIKKFSLSCAIYTAQIVIKIISHGYKAEDISSYATLDSREGKLAKVILNAIENAEGTSIDLMPREIKAKYISQIDTDISNRISSAIHIDEDKAAELIARVRNTNIPLS